MRVQDGCRGRRYGRSSVGDGEAPGGRGPVREADRALWASIGPTPSERFVTLPSIGTSVRVQEVGSGPLFLWGADDPQGGEAVARPFVAQIPGAVLELVPGAGHAPWFDEPDAIATRVAGFIGGSSPQANEAARRRTT